MVQENRDFKPAWSFNWTCNRERCLAFQFRFYSNSHEQEFEEIMLYLIGLGLNQEGIQRKGLRLPEDAKRFILKTTL